MIKYLPVKGFEGIYEISSEGKVYSINFNRFCGRKLRKTWIRPDGYEQIFLNKNKTKKAYKVHRIVAIAFLPNPNNYKDVNHKNGNKKDNRVENLEWCNRSQNVQHAYDTGLKPILTGSRNGNSKVVLDIMSHIFYDTAKECSIISGIKYMTLCNMLSGRCSNWSRYRYV